MYASPSHRYSRQQPYYGGSNASYSPTKYGSSTSGSYEGRMSPVHGRHQYYQSPMKAQSYQRNYASSSYGNDYYASNNGQYYHADGTTYYHSSGSTASSSSSQEGYFADDLEDYDEYRSMFSVKPDADPEMTTVPTVPTPLSLSKYEHGKTPSGRVLVTSGNQTVEFFSSTVNAPTRCMFVSN
ncbi:hypothetical protein Poli38472_007199 [Pythium oligandrum]|uniref:Uncharacterized protein n=1 Tax=Pythium oligandrum TaxID=41045 RepID=A0A8K1FFJ7_PYTOL|nr:hypothetical protein Poli38472_007199 [Pythium oligandrum]|eukprot:TMW59054.1 hypothetical protein Poli38472_007199 [Pythium oligandrum]